MLNDAAQKVRRFGQKEAVLVGIYLMNVIVDLVEKSQAEQFFFRQKCRLIVFLALNAVRLGLGKKRTELVFGKRLKPRIFLYLGLGKHGCRFFECFLHIAVADVNKAVALYLLKISGNAAALAREVINRESITISQGEKAVGTFVQSLRIGSLHVLQSLAILVYQFRILCHHSAQFCSTLYVILVEDVAGKRFQLLGNVPVPVLVHILLDELDNPFQFHRCWGEPFKKLVYGAVAHLVLSEVYLQIRRQVEFARQILQHRLEERVDCLNAEVRIVVQNVGEGKTCVPPYNLIVKPCFFLQFFEIAF